MSSIEQASYKLPKIVDGTLSTLAAHILFIPQHLRTHYLWKMLFDITEQKTGKKIDFTRIGIDNTLTKYLRYYEESYRERIARETNKNQHIWALNGTNAKLVKRRFGKMVYYMSGILWLYHIGWPAQNYLVLMPLVQPCCISLSFGHYRLEY